MNVYNWTETQVSPLTPEHPCGIADVTMSNLENGLKLRPQVFVSYASADIAAAKSLVDGLRSRGLNVWLDVYEIQPGENIAESIRTAVSASSYLLLLCSSQSDQSLWFGDTVKSVLKEAQSRGVTVLPVLLDDCEVPRSLSLYQGFDMRSGISENLEKLAAALQSTPTIDFEKLSPQNFEQLVIALLQKLGFVNIRLSEQGRDVGFDAIAEFRQKDPFGAETREIYLVELKLYRNSRADLRALRTLAYSAENYPEATKALLVTNGNLTSVALEWVNDTARDTGIPIRVIDGTELKRLLFQNTDLVAKYFPNSLSTAA
jgi:TIR domain/Restriction endonuclease